MPAKLKRLLMCPGFVVVVAFLVRMAYLSHFFHTYEEPMVGTNLPFGTEMGTVAASIASGHGFSSPLRMVHTGPTALFAPAYPYLLAGIFKLFGIFSYTSNLAIRTIDIAFASFAVWPIYSIGKNSFGEKVGVVSAWVWAFLPAAIYFPAAWVWDTALTGLWMALLFAATLRLRGSCRMWAWIGYGALWGAGALINPSLLSVLPFLAFWAIWPLRQQWKRAIRLALTSSGIFFACISPWTVRNYRVFHALVPLRSNFGMELWLGNNSLYQAGYATSLNPTNNMEQAKEYARLTEIPYMAEKRREALAFIRSHPQEAASLVFLRFADTWTGMWGAPADSWSHLTLSYKVQLASTCLFSLLAFLGAFFAYRAGNHAALPFSAMMLFFPLVFYLTHAAMRYRFPLDAVMTVLAVYAVAHPLTQLAGGQPAVRPAAAPHASGPAE